MWEGTARDCEHQQVTLEAGYHIRKTLWSNVTDEGWPGKQIQP